MNDGIYIKKPVPQCSKECGRRASTSFLPEKVLCERCHALEWYAQERILEAHRAEQMRRAQERALLHPEALKRHKRLESESRKGGWRRSKQTVDKLEITFVGGEMDGRVLKMYPNQIDVSFYYGEEYHATPVTLPDGSECVVMALSSLTGRGVQVLFEAILCQRNSSV